MGTISCNCCDRQDETLLFASRDILYKTTGNIFRVVRCNYCGLVYLNPQPSTEEIATFYPNTYRPYRPNNTAATYATPEEPTRKILDIGCGSGDLLIAIAKKHHDWEIRGIDFDARAAETARSYGFQVFHGSLREAQFADNLFDELHMNHVLEHIQNPSELLAESARILNQTGIISITIPNFRSLSRMLFGNKWYHLDSPRHLYHFTPHTLTRMLKQNGFTEVCVSFVPSPKYFLQSFALWRSGKKRKWPRAVWYALAIPAYAISWLGLSSTMQVRAKKN